MHDPSTPAPDSGSARGTATSRSLLAGVRRFDAEAWERLVRLYGPFVYAICRRRLGNAEDARDLVQQVFKTVAEKIDRFRRERESDTFRGWLATVTRNKIHDHYRLALRRPRIAQGSTAHRRLADIAAPPQDGDDARAEPDVVREDVRALFRRALDEIRPQFKDSTWRAFWLTAVDGRMAKDVAEELGMSAGAVRVAKSRVLQRLRSELGDIDD